MLHRTKLDLLSEPETFLWAVGIEDTFITAPWPATGRTLDEYELVGHYDCWRDDIGLIATLGIKTVRYGIPWHRINPAPKKWDWKWADRPLERFLELGIAPIVDLVHYGLPTWMNETYLDGEFPERMADYAARVAERFRGRIYAYTPLNEPRITAWYCGRLGWWPPFLKGWRGFLRVMLPVCRAIVLTCRRLWEVDSELAMVHVDASEIYSTDDERLAGEVQWRQQLVFLGLDLISGRVTDRHPLWQWLLSHGATEYELEWFIDQGIPLDVIGFNLYPMFSNKWLMKSSRGLRGQMRYASPELAADLALLYWERYGRPMMITETASRRTVARRQAWLDGSVEAVRGVRSRGIPLVGYTWWPVFGIIRWAYRQGRQPVAAYIDQMGLWDLALTSDGKFERRHTPLVDAYRELVAGEDRAVGHLRKPMPVRP